MSGQSQGQFPERPTGTTTSKFISVRERTQKGEGANKTERLRAAGLHSHQGGFERASSLFRFFCAFGDPDSTSPCAKDSASLAETLHRISYRDHARRARLPRPRGERCARRSSIEK